MASMDPVSCCTHHTPQEKVVLPATDVTDSWPKIGNVTLDDLSLTYTYVLDIRKQISAIVNFQQFKSHGVVSGIAVGVASGSTVVILGRTGR